MQFFLKRLLLTAFWVPTTTLLAAITASELLAQTTADIDRLTEKWLGIERQTAQLSSEWRTQKPILEQRLALLAAEKEQLKIIIDRSQQQDEGVQEQRLAMLQEQSLLEKQQSEIQTALSKLLSNNAILETYLPPPLRNSWVTEQASAGVSALESDPASRDNQDSNTSQELQLAIAELSRLLEFDERISLHEGMIESPSGEFVKVTQLYLGVGFAWFLSDNGLYSGWGRATRYEQQTEDGDGWAWHFSSDIDTSEIAKAIEIYRRLAPADFVSLPVHIASASMESRIRSRTASE